MSKQKPKPESRLIQPHGRFPVFDKEFQDNLGWWYKSDQTKVKKIFVLVSDTMMHPFEGLGKPEPLKYLSDNIWSRRINLEHRLVYRVLDERIDFLSCRYHYEQLTE